MSGAAPYLAPFYLLHYFIKSLVYRYHYKRHQVEIFHAGERMLFTCFIEYRTNKITGTMYYRYVKPDQGWAKTKGVLPEIIKTRRL